ncbi:MAG: hypothetical protein KF873_06660 [Gemmataceae bacterium]|nr:hypothetical protein [Gemmataceae bacterium]
MAKRRRDDDEYEVDEERPRRRSSRRTSDEDDTRPNRLARTTAEEGFEVVDDEPPRKSKRRPIEDDEDDDRPRSKSKRRPIEDDEDDDRPRKKKSRLTKKDRARLRQEELDARDEAQANAMMEWGTPIFLTFLGAVLMIASGVILANRSDGLINPALLLGVAFGFTLVTIPVIIVALMVIGGVCGIEYGTLTNAVRSLIAISMISWGIFFFTRLFFIGWMLGPLISFIVTFGLFMVFFNLDSQEAMTTLGALNLLMWLADKLFWLVIIIAVTRGGNRDRDFDRDEGPRIGNKANQFGGGGGNNRFDPDDFDDN